MHLLLKLKFVFILSLLCHAAFAQNNVKPLFRIDTTASFISIDKLDNTYLVTADNELLKYSPTGKLLWNYSNRNLGRLTQIDATDPFRIVLFYPALEQVVVLNNNLNEINRYSFAQDATRQITLVASANTNGYWVFDQNNRELIRLSNNFADELQSGNYYQRTGKDVKPTMIRADNQYVYLYDPQQGVLQFDRFGAYVKTIATGALTNFQVKENFLICTLGNSVKKINIQSSLAVTIPLPIQQPVLQIAAGNQIISILTGKAVFLYALKQWPELTGPD